MKYSQVTVHIVLENIQRTKQYKSLISLVECSIPLVCVWHLFAKLSCDSCGFLCKLLTLFHCEVRNHDTVTKKLTDKNLNVI